MFTDHAMFANNQLVDISKLTNKKKETLPILRFKIGFLRKISLVYVSFLKL